MLNTKISDCFLGKALIVSDGKTEITVTLDVGPRIIGLRPVGGFNVMYQDVTDSVNHDCSSYYGKGKKWHIYGGHRLWLSPEDESTYYPDNDPVRYEINDDTVSFYPDNWKKVRVSPSVSVTFNLDGTLSVKHSVTNLGSTRPICIWALTVMKSGGKMVLPLSTKNTGYLANRNLVMWHYASVKDSRFDLQDDKIILNSSVSVPEPFKFGTLCENIRASYELTEDGRTQTFTKMLDADLSCSYPDYSCNFESYCTHLIHEMETLSPIVTLRGGETLTHTEIWKIE